MQHIQHIQHIADTISFIVVNQIPNPPPKPPPGLVDISNTIIGWLKWAVLTAGVVGILVCGLMMIIGRRHRNQMASEGLASSAWVLGGLAAASTAATLVGAFVI